MSYCPGLAPLGQYSQAVQQRIPWLLHCPVGPVPVAQEAQRLVAEVELGLRLAPLEQSPTTRERERREALPAPLSAPKTTGT